MALSGFQIFIEEFREVFRLKSVTMIIRHAETQEIKSLWLCGVAMEWFKNYSLEYAREDLLAQRIMISPIARFYASNPDISHLERFAETRFYNMRAEK